MRFSVTGAVTRLGAATLLASVLLSGCYQEVRVDDPDGAPLPWDAGVGSFTPPPGKCAEGAGVDLLFVVDNSNSMLEEQESLIAELPALIRSLVDPPDADGDGERDWLPVTDLQVGVVTSDMGSGGHEIPTCARSEYGDDGILRTAGNTSGGCMAAYPSFMAFEPGSGASTDAFAMDVGCVAVAGNGGCGFEQPLEAMLKALAPARPTSATGPSYEPPRFFANTYGHGDDANAGFVRPDSLLAVVVLADEDDCSARDGDLFDASSPVYSSALNLRCHAHPEALHPIDRFVDGLVALRRDRPDLIAYALIGGVPADLVEPISSVEGYARILDDPRMQERTRAEMPEQLEASCEGTHGLAFPPRRLVEVARGLGPARSTVQSICADSFAPAAAAIGRLLGRRACSAYTE